MATTVISVRFRAFRPATIPDADAAVLANVQFRAGTVTEVVGYRPWRTVKQQAGNVRIVFSRSAFRIYDMRGKTATLHALWPEAYLLILTFK